MIVKKFDQIVINLPAATTLVDLRARIMVIK